MTTDSHLLIVDDDERIRTLLQKYLIRNGFMVSIARDAEHARRVLAGLDFDLAIIDIMMPGEDGISLTKYLHETRGTPVLLLTAKGDTEDRIIGLEAGADDYLAKPFEPKELLLRINAILRRAPTVEDRPAPPKVLYLGDIRYDVIRAEMWRGDTLVRLTSTETQLMRIFAAETGQPISRATLVEKLGRDHGQAQERAVDVQVTRLRKKIEQEPKQPVYLQTVRGSGYMLCGD